MILGISNSFPCSRLSRVVGVFKGLGTVEGDCPVQSNCQLLLEFFRM
jgi:hypothetical protein